MDARISNILDEYSSQYIDSAFYLKQNKTNKGTKNPLLFVYLGSSAFKYQTGIKEYSNRYFSNLNGVAFLSIYKSSTLKDDTNKDLNNYFYLDIPDDKYSEDSLENRKNILSYLDTNKFEDEFESCIIKIVKYFMEYGNIYDEGGSVQVYIVSPADSPEAGIVNKIMSLINKFVSHIYNPNFTLYSLFDDINIKKEVKVASHVTFDEISTIYKDNSNIIVILIGSKKLNGLFDRPSELVDNQCHLMALSTYISVMSSIKLFPPNIQSTYSLGISNLKIIEKYVGLSTLVCLFKKVLDSISQQRTDNEDIDAETEIDKYIKTLSNRGEIVLSQMKKAIYNSKPINNMNMCLSEAEITLFYYSLREYFNDNFTKRYSDEFDKFVIEHTNKILFKKMDVDQLIQKLMKSLLASEDTLNSIGGIINEANDSPLNIYRININGNKQIRDLIIKNIYEREMQKQLLNIKIKLINKLISQLKIKNKDISIKYNKLEELLYFIEQYLAGNNLSNAISNYYKGSIESDIKVPKEFINKCISEVFNAKNEDVVEFLQSLCNYIINDSIFATIGSTNGMDQMIIDELLLQLDKKSSPYCFTLQIGANINTQKFYFGNMESSLLNKLIAMDKYTTIHDDNSKDTITMLQVFTIDDLSKIDYVSKCKQSFEETYK